MAISATSKIGACRESQDLAKNSVDAELNFFKDNEDGSAPAPWVFDKEETFHRPHNTRLVHINDVRGDESKYTLDGNGFQFYHHKATEREFLDDDQIRGSYYPEVEQLLKTMLVPTPVAFQYQTAANYKTAPMRPESLSSITTSDARILPIT